MLGFGYWPNDKDRPSKVNEWGVENDRDRMQIIPAHYLKEAGVTHKLC